MCEVPIVESPPKTYVPSRAPGLWFPYPFMEMNGACSLESSECCGLTFIDLQAATLDSTPCAGLSLPPADLALPREDDSALWSNSGAWPLLVCVGGGSPSSLPSHPYIL